MQESARQTHETKWADAEMLLKNSKRIFEAAGASGVLQTLRCRILQRTILLHKASFEPSLNNAYKPQMVAACFKWLKLRHAARTRQGYICIKWKNSFCRPHPPLTSTSLKILEDPLTNYLWGQIQFTYKQKLWEVVLAPWEEIKAETS